MGALRYFLCLQIITTNLFLMVIGADNSSSLANDTLSHQRELSDGGCDIEPSTSKVSFNFEIGSTAILDCNIPATESNCSMYWLKDGKTISKNQNATSSKYTIRVSNNSDKVNCYRFSYKLEFEVGADEAGYYKCGCQYSNWTSQRGFWVEVNGEQGITNLLVGAITISTYIIVGCFHLAAIMSLIVLAIQMKHGGPKGFVYRPARLLAIIIGEPIAMVAVLTIPFLQYINVIPKCCKAGMFQKMVGVAAVLFGTGIIIILIAVLVYRKVKSTRKKRRIRKRSAIQDSEEATDTQVAPSEVAVRQELQEAVVDQTPQQPATDQDRTSLTAPLAIHEDRLSPTAPVPTQEAQPLLPPAPPLDHEPLPGQQCCVCCETPVQVCFPQCGHANLCHGCATLVIAGRGRCPMCNETVNILSVLYT